MKLSLSFKLILGFMAVALITLVVGIVGYWGISNTSQGVDTLGKSSIPSILNLEIVKVNQSQIKIVLRTLVSPYLTDEDYTKQMDLVEKSRKAYRAALADYDSVSRTPQEDTLYKSFLAALDPSIKANNAAFDFAAKLRAAKTKPDDYSHQMTELVISGTDQKLFDDMTNSLQALLDYVKHYYGVELVQKFEQDALFVNLLILAFGLSGVVLALALGVVLSRSVSKPIAKVTLELADAAKSLESASLQVSSSSQQLSSGSTELASSIEEMTSSLEELQSIIESNTKNVNQSELLMQETSQEAKRVTEKISELKESLIEISGNSKKISKIIKVIDDIAFQTNILALNAAVEAARAGDAGKGFAVVADQVKSLALKSAEAAKETSDLIERAIESTNRGETLGQGVLEAQYISVEKASKVAVLLDEVNRASKEQLKGANQITQAVTQVNTIVQTTAANSEENAAAGEELLTQSENLGSNVGQLKIIITGKSDQSLKTVNNAKTPSRSESLENYHLPTPSSRPVKGIEVVKPEDVIPLKDFKDF